MSIQPFPLLLAGRIDGSAQNAKLNPMIMHKSPHPGEFIQATYMGPFGVSGRSLALHLDVAASTLNRILKQQSGISPEMALRLSKALGRSPESWLAMQDAYDLWVAKKTVKLSRVHPLDLSTT